MKKGEFQGKIRVPAPDDVAWHDSAPGPVSNHKTQSSWGSAFTPNIAISEAEVFTALVLCGQWRTMSSELKCNQKQDA